MFVNHLTQNWLPALPDVQAKLTAGERVRIAEVGCGEGLAAHHDRPRLPERRDRRLRPRRGVDRRRPQGGGRRRRGRPGPVRGARRRRPGHRGRLRPRHGHRDAARRARPGRDPAHDEAAGRRAAAPCSSSTSAPRTRFTVPASEMERFFYTLQHAALPGGEHAGRRRRHRHGDPRRHRAAATPPRPASRPSTSSTSSIRSSCSTACPEPALMRRRRRAPAPLDRDVRRGPGLPRICVVHPGGASFAISSSASSRPTFFQRW